MLGRGSAQDRVLQGEQRRSFNNTQCNAYHRTGEAAICARAAEQHPQNYHAWSHRQRVLRLKAPSVQYVWAGGVKCEVRGGAWTDADAQVQDELARMRDWARRHVSDHSGLHYRQALLLELERHVHHTRPYRYLWVDSYFTTDWTAAVHSAPGQRYTHACSHALGGCFKGVDCVVAVPQELVFCGELSRWGGGHEAVWCHRRLVMAMLARADLAHVRDSAPPPMALAYAQYMHHVRSHEE